MTPTPDQQEFIEGIRDAVTYWRREDRVNRDEALSGLAHSILCHLDGVTGQAECCYDLIRVAQEPEEGPTPPERRVSTMFHELLYREGWR